MQHLGHQMLPNRRLSPFTGMPMPFHDLRIAVRHLLKSPGFTATAVLMLALGVGATTAIFSIVEGVLLRPLPFPNSERLVQIGDILQGADVGGNGEAGVTAPDIQAYTRDTHSFESLGGYTQTGYELSGIGNPAQVNAARLSSGVLPTLQVAPLMGRFFTQQEDENKVQVAVLSYSLWQDRLHGDPRVLGTKILLDRKPYEVIGVMPRNFEFPLAPGHMNSSELWIPMSFREQELGAGGAAGWNFNMVGRLKPEITAAQAQSDAQRVAEEIMRGYPPFMSSLHIHAVVRSLHEETVEQARQLVRTLFLAIVVVLLIACANLAGLLLVRAIRRRREIAMRLALGARATVLLRQTILESLVLSVTGGLRWYRYAGSDHIITDGPFAGGPSDTLTQATSVGLVKKLNVSWKAGLGTLFYAQAAQGFRPGFGRAPLPSICVADAKAAGINPADNFVRPDSVWNYEAGIKTEGLGGRLRVDADTFLIKWSGVQQGVFLQCGFNIPSNAGDATSRGFEFEAEWHATPAITLGGEASYTATRFDRTTPGSLDQPGDPILEVPKWQGSAYAEYGFSGPLGTLGLAHIEVQYVGSSLLFYQDDPASAPADLSFRNKPSLILINVRVQLEKGPWRVALFGRNLANSIRITGFPNDFTIDLPERPRFEVSRPRTIGVELARRL